MKKIFCDRCKNEIKGCVISSNSSVVRLNITRTQLISWVANKDEKVDLCEECHAAVYNFIFNNKEEPTE